MSTKQSSLASILPSLPLERDLPLFLLSTSTELQHVSIYCGLLVVIVSFPWSPGYSKFLNASDLVDRYQWFLEEHPEMKDDEGLYVQEDYEHEEGKKPGTDYWGLLYHVTKQDNRLVDLKRLASDDFAFFFGEVVRSENGKVLCIETGTYASGDDGEDHPNACTPVIHTVHASLENGFEIKKPLTCERPDGLEDTYSSKMNLTPGGDYMFATFSDLGNIESSVFYEHRDDGWEQLWKDPENECVDGFFTIDGDFVLTENGNYWYSTPGPMAKRVVTLCSSDDWLSSHPDIKSAA